MAAINPARALGLHASIAGGNRWVVVGGAARRRVAKDDEAVGGAPHRRERKVVGVWTEEREKNSHSSVMMTCDVVWCTSRKLNQTSKLPELEKKKDFN